MAAAVPALERASRILATMAREPVRPYTATEMSQQVGLHRGTAHALLACLAGLGMVTRDPEAKTYTLGPELIRLGRASADQHAGAQPSRVELHALAAALDVGGLVCVRIGDELAIVEQVGSDVAEFGLPATSHARVPLVPPVGAIFFAWSSPGEIERWIGRAPSSATPDELESYRRSVAAVRTRGYSIGSEAEFERQLSELLATFETPGPADRLGLALRLADLVRHEAFASRGSPGHDLIRRTGEPRSIGHVIAPVFDERGEVSMSLTLFGRPGQITDTNLATYVDPLLGAVRRLTSTVGGQRPDAPRSLG